MWKELITLACQLCLDRLSSGLRQLWASINDLPPKEQKSVFPHSMKKKEEKKAYVRVKEPRFKLLALPFALSRPIALILLDRLLSSRRVRVILRQHLLRHAVPQLPRFKLLLGRQWPDRFRREPQDV